MQQTIRVLGLALAALVVSIPAQAQSPAPPKTGPVALTVRVQNNSATCVWVSVAYGMIYTPWSWMHEAHNTARFIRPLEHYDFTVVTANALPVPVPMEAKVEGTFMQHKDCSGAHARELTAENKGIQANHHYGTIAKAIAYLTGHDPASYAVSVYNDASN